MIAPPWVPVPPRTYGGTELVIDGLSRGLEELGHHVTLFTTGDSTCPVGRAFLFDHSDPDRMGAAVLELRHVAAAYDVLDELDVIHDHTLAGLFLARMHTAPVVTTNHGPFDDDLTDLYRRVGKHVPIIAISHDQASHAPPDIPIAAVIHHGLILDQYPFSAEAGDGLVFLGRMSPNKGIDDAITSAKSVGRPLKIAAKMREPGEHRYFHDSIEPQLSSDIEYIGEVGLDEKVELLANAAALINPIRWPEPFGLVMIEALACGTPVVVNRAGAAPEIVDHGVTGFVADNFDELVSGLELVGTYERTACRAAVEQRFTHIRMARDHEAFYRRVLEQQPAS
jgi:glycosyltransferase involved in cell wall biosynthesis